MNYALLIIFVWIDGGASSRTFGEFITSKWNRFAWSCISEKGNIPEKTLIKFTNLDGRVVQFPANEGCKEEWKDNLELLFYRTRKRESGKLHQGTYYAESVYCALEGRRYGIYLKGGPHYRWSPRGAETTSACNRARQFYGEIEGLI